MEVIITNSEVVKEGKDFCIKSDQRLEYWYKDAIGIKFDVSLRIHPTFGYKEYILLDTERNKEHFKSDELSILVLKLGHFGIKYEHAKIILK